MRRVTPQIRNLATRLLTYEANENPSSEIKPPVFFPVCEKLRLTLSTFMGHGGYRALLSRALALAREEVPLLGKVSVKEDGSLEGAEELHAQLDAEEFLETRITLLAHLFELLMAFIGESLTLHMVHEVWPRVSIDDLEFNKRDKT